MPINLYRGDSRTPGEIQAAGGFHARIPLPQATAVALISRCMDQAGPYAPVILPPGPTAWQAALDKPARINLGALMQGIKAEKNQTTMHISTDVSQACGGYASGNIYKMDFTLNYQHHGQGPVLPAGNNVGLLSSPVKPHLVFDGPNLAASPLIALSRGMGDLTEVAFLTSIPYANITHYKLPNTVAWIPMP